MLTGMAMTTWKILGTGFINKGEENNYEKSIIFIDAFIGSF